MEKPSVNQPISKAMFFVLTSCLVLALVSSRAYSRGAHQEHKHDQHHAQGSDKWAELEAYHEVMSQTFHPAEEGKLEPIRKRAGELAERAKQWRDSKPPKIYDVPAIKEKLVRLETESKALAEAVAKNASDEQIKKDLTALHDRFHEVIGACQNEKKKQQ